MDHSRWKQMCVAGSLSCALLVGIPLFAGAPRSQDAQQQAASGDASASNERSQITNVVVTGSQPAGTFGGVAYVRTWGTVFGFVGPGDAIIGFDTLPHDSKGNYGYEVEFELIAPEKAGTNSVILVEAENRGTPVLLNALEQIGEGGPPSQTTDGGKPGNGFLFSHGTSYARVQWQTGVAKDIPANAEGVGEVIMRDFGRMLAGHTELNGKPPVEIGKYPTLILGGISLSGFYIDTFLAEGFNADPRTGIAVFQGAIAVDGTGNWIAINELAAQAGTQEFPYVVPDAKPLKLSDIISGHASDPFYVDIANYTDFYRLRASLTDVETKMPRTRRYDWPSAHAPAPLDQRAFAGRVSRCNGGVPLDLNPIPHDAYLRAVVLEMERELDVPSARKAPRLPPSKLFLLDAASSRTPNFNALPGVRLSVPLIDEHAQPMGGVRFPDVEYPVGKALPPSVSPVTTASIDATCGNLGGWKQYSAAELTTLYGSEANYLKLYAQQLDRLIEQGYVLREDREDMLKTASALYNRRPVESSSAPGRH
jgi:hypothetical protein